MCEGGSPKRTRNPLPNPTSSQKGCLEELPGPAKASRGLQGSRGPPGAVPGPSGSVPGASRGRPGLVFQGLSGRRETHYQTQHPRKKGCSEDCCWNSTGFQGSPEPFWGLQGGGASRGVQTGPDTCAAAPRRPGRPKVRWVSIVGVRPAAFEYLVAGTLSFG